MDEDSKRRLEELQKNIPFLDSMIEQLEASTSDQHRKDKLNKLKSIRHLLADKNRVRIENLHELEKVVFNLKKAMEQQMAPNHKAVPEPNPTADSDQLKIVRKKLMMFTKSVLDDREKYPEQTMTDSKEVSVAKCKEPALFQLRPKPSISSDRDVSKKSSTQMCNKSYTRVLASPERRCTDLGRLEATSPLTGHKSCDEEIVLTKEKKVTAKIVNKASYTQKVELSHIKEDFYVSHSDNEDTSNQTKDKTKDSSKDNFSSDTPKKRGKITISLPNKSREISGEAYTAPKPIEIDESDFKMIEDEDSENFKDISGKTSNDQQTIEEKTPDNSNGANIEQSSKITSIDLTLPVEILPSEETISEPATQNLSNPSSQDVEIPLLHDKVLMIDQPKEDQDIRLNILQALKSDALSDMSKTPTSETSTIFQPKLTKVTNIQDIAPKKYISIEEYKEKKLLKPNITTPLLSDNYLDLFDVQNTSSKPTSNTDIQNALMSPFGQTDKPSAPVNPVGSTDWPTNPLQAIGLSNCPPATSNPLERTEYPVTLVQSFNTQDVPTTFSHAIGRSYYPTTPTQPTGRTDFPSTPTNSFIRTDAPLPSFPHLSQSEYASTLNQHTVNTTNFPMTNFQPFGLAGQPTISGPPLVRSDSHGQQLPGSRPFGSGNIIVNQPLGRSDVALCGPNQIIPQFYHQKHNNYYKDQYFPRDDHRQGHYNKNYDGSNFNRGYRERSVGRNHYYNEHRGKYSPHRMDKYNRECRSSRDSSVGRSSRALSREFDNRRFRSRSRNRSKSRNYGYEENDSENSDNQESKRDKYQRHRSRSRAPSKSTNYEERKEISQDKSKPNSFNCERKRDASIGKSQVKKPQEPVSIGLKNVNCNDLIEIPNENVNNDTKSENDSNVSNLSKTVKGDSKVNKNKSESNNSQISPIKDGSLNDKTKKVTSLQSKCQSTNYKIPKIKRTFDDKTQIKEGKSFKEKDPEGAHRKELVSKNRPQKKGSNENRHKRNQSVSQNTEDAEKNNTGSGTRNISTDIFKKHKSVDNNEPYLSQDNSDKDDYTDKHIKTPSKKIDSKIRKRKHIQRLKNEIRLDYPDIEENKREKKNKCTKGLNCKIIDEEGHNAKHPKIEKKNTTKIVETIQNEEQPNDNPLISDTLEDKTEKQTDINQSSPDSTINCNEINQNKMCQDSSADCINEDLNETQSTVTSTHEDNTEADTGIDSNRLKISINELLNLVETKSNMEIKNKLQELSVLVLNDMNTKDVNQVKAPLKADETKTELLTIEKENTDSEIEKLKSNIIHDIEKEHSQVRYSKPGPKSKKILPKQNLNCSESNSNTLDTNDQSAIRVEDFSDTNSEMLCNLKENNTTPKSLRKQSVIVQLETKKLGKGITEILTKNVSYCYTDKSYCFSKTVSIYSCRLCLFSGENIVAHYDVQHPHSEIPLSRMDPQTAKQAIEQCKLINLSAVRKTPSEKHVCRFCYKDFVKCTDSISESFFRHVVSMHTGEYERQCSECNDNNTECPFKLEIPQPPENNEGPLIGYICVRCNFTQISLKNLETHVMKRHNNERSKVYAINLANMTDSDVEMIIKNYQTDIDNVSTPRLLTSSQVKPTVTKESDNSTADVDNGHHTSESIPNKRDKDGKKIVTSEEIDKTTPQSSVINKESHTIDSSLTMGNSSKKPRLSTDGVLNNAKEISETRSSENTYQYPHFKISFSDVNVKEYVCCIYGIDDHFKTDRLINMRTHVKTTHKELWDGYCNICKMLVAPGHENNFEECLQHFIDKHMDKYPVSKNTPSGGNPPDSCQHVEESLSKPVINVRPLSELIPKAIDATTEEEATPDYKIENVFSIGTPSEAQVINPTAYPKSKLNEEFFVNVIQEKNTVIQADMLKTEKLIKVYKCAGRFCSFTSDSVEQALQHASTHARVGGAGALRCAYCSFDCAGNAIDLVTHVFRGHGPCAFACARCFYRAAAPQLVAAHAQRAHPVMRVQVLSARVMPQLSLEDQNIITQEDAVQFYKCPHACEFHAITAAKFCDHIQQTHANEIQHTCYMCSESLGCAAELVEHMKRHELNVYQCTRCVHGADSEAQLLAHAAAAHPACQPQAYLRLITTKDCSEEISMVPALFSNTQFEVEEVTTTLKNDDPIIEVTRSVNLEELLAFKTIEDPVSSEAESQREQSSAEDLIKLENLYHPLETQSELHKLPDNTIIQGQDNLMWPSVDNEDIICLDSDGETPTDSIVGNQAISLKLSYPNVANPHYASQLQLEVSYNKIPMDKLMQCPRCFKTFKSKNGFKKHIDRCLHGMISIKCPHCDRIINNENDLFDHYFLDHDSSRDHKCGVCNAMFYSAGVVRQHMKKYHRVSVVTVEKDLNGLGYTAVATSTSAMSTTLKSPFVAESTSTSQNNSLAAMSRLPIHSNMDVPHQSMLHQLPPYPLPVNPAPYSAPIYPGPSSVSHNPPSCAGPANQARCGPSPQQTSYPAFSNPVPYTAPINPAAFSASIYPKPLSALVHTAPRSSTNNPTPDSVTNLGAHPVSFSRPTDPARRPSPHNPVPHSSPIYPTSFPGSMNSAPVSASIYSAPHTATDNSSPLSSPNYPERVSGSRSSPLDPNNPVSYRPHINPSLQIASNINKMARLVSNVTASMRAPPTLAQQHQPPSWQRGKYICTAENCFYATEDVEDFVSHWRFLHSHMDHFVCMVCSETMHPDRIKEHLQAHGGVPCTSTSTVRVIDSFSEPNLISRHWQCGLCQFKSPYKSGILMHCEVTHQSKIQYRCLHCPLFSEVRSVIKNHMQVKHAGKSVEELHCYYQEGTVPDVDGMPRWMWQVNNTSQLTRLLQQS